MGTRNRVNKNKPSTKPGEAAGPDTEEIKAAEQVPETAQETNPVGEATQHESKDPYAEGKHIANPEPNNGKGEDADQEFNDQGQEVPADVANSDSEEQDEVAEGRTETPAEAEGSGEEEPTEEDPLAKEANEKAV